MTYAQKDYSSKIGDSHNTIAEAGSLLTAIANLLTHFGYDQSPEAIASKLESLEADPANIAWSNISQILPNIGIFSIGNGAPQYSDSIVMFDHNGRVSYAAVADANAGTIIDSFDGEEKDWDLYGAPKMFVTFVKYQPLVVTPLVLAVPATIQEPEAVSEKPDYEPFDLTRDDPIDTNSGIYADQQNVVIPVKTLSESSDWKMTLKTGLGVIEGIAKHDAIIHDLDGEQPDVELKEGTVVNIAGRFVKDGTPYYRTVGSTNNDHWYGIPAGVLGKSERQEEDDFEHMLEDITMDIEDTGDLSKRDKVIKGAATIEGKMLGIFKRGNKEAKEIA